jgi:DNA-binding XRE family transcriptional regulator
MKTTNIQQSTVRRRMKMKRIDSGISQEALAKAAGIDRKTVNRIENGHFSPNLDTFFRLCVALDVRPSDIMKGISK